MFIEMVQEIAVNNDLSKFVKHFPKYTKKGKDGLLKAFTLLDESKANGHEYIEDKYNRMIEDLYS